MTPDATPWVGFHEKEATIRSGASQLMATLAGLPFPIPFLGTISIADALLNAVRRLERERMRDLRRVGFFDVLFTRRTCPMNQAVRSKPAGAESGRSPIRSLDFVCQRDD
jgi:hypothetical protein